MTRAALLVALASLVAGCATLRPRAHVMEFTPEDKDESHQKTVLEKFSALRESDIGPDGTRILLFVESYPKGLIPNGRSVVNSPASDYDLLGGFDLYATGATTFWFADYASTPRKVLCYPQVPLTWVTLGLWQFVSPLAWPCVAKARMDRSLAWSQVRHVARAAGADAAVVLLKSQDDEVIDAWGWLLKKKASAHTEPKDVGSGQEAEGQGGPVRREGEAAGSAGGLP
ncbi:MAG: hypothetical protein ACJ790_16740 [Myxococcaceae bacterium]